MTNLELFKLAVKNGLRVMYWDIETSPMLVWTYGLFNQNMGIGQIEQDIRITSLAYLFEHNPTKVITDEWQHKGLNDSDMLNRTAKVISGIDLIIAQNGDGFDTKVFNWRLNQLNLTPLTVPISIDTLKMSRKVFRPSSHKLDYRSKAYGFGGKIHQDMSDCIAVALGDKQAQKRRIEYNIKDTIDLRKIFLKELNYYILPVKVKRLLESFAFCEKKASCSFCAQQKQAKYDVIVQKNYITCNRCGGKEKLRDK